MAENKKSFLLYADYIHTFEQLTDEEAGKLIKHVLAYVNDKDPQTDDKLLKIAFEPIRQQLKRDLKHWEGIKEKRSKAGKASAEARSQAVTNSTSVDICEQAPTDSTVNVNDNVNVNDTVNVTVINRERETPALSNMKHSNLFRQPKVPNFEDVARVFVQNGGTKEMAESFYNKYEATGWFFNNSPITNFSSMVPNYIRNWVKNEQSHGTNQQRTSKDSARPNSTITPV